MAWVSLDLAVAEVFALSMMILHCLRSRSTAEVAVSVAVVFGRRTRELLLEVDDGAFVEVEVDDVGLARHNYREVLLLDDVALRGPSSRSSGSSRGGRMKVDACVAVEG